MHFLPKLEQIEKRYDSLTAELSDPQVFGDPAAYQRSAKAHSELQEIVDRYREWKEIQKALVGTRNLLEESSSDSAMRALVKVFSYEYGDVDKYKVTVFGIAASLSG